MPSDDAYDRIGEALSPATAAFQSAVTDAIEQVRSFIEAHSPTRDSAGTRSPSGLGVFGEDHIDEGRFAALLNQGDRRVDADTLHLLDSAIAAMKKVSGSGDSGFTVDVVQGGDVAAGAAAAFASIGRAFGAARIAELVRTGRIREAAGDVPEAPFPFDRWTAAERRIAPPVVVRLAGADLDASAFAGYLDGNQKIVLIVDSPSAAAPLARLITPGTFVMQTVEPADIARLAQFAGPGIAAVVPEGSATFVHDPAAAQSDRLVVFTKPQVKPQALRRSSVFQQLESLALLELFESALSAAATPAAADVERTPVIADVTANAPASPRGETTVDPADRLAAWLLAQADLGGAGQVAER